MNAEMYDALKEAGASEDKARAAATSVAAYDSQLAEIKGDMKVLRWMVTFNIAMTVAILYRVFMP